MSSDSQGDSIVFNIKCSDDQEVSYIHRPGRTSWRYLHNLLRSGLADSRDVDLSPYITSRGVKILERIFGCPHPISSIRSPISGTKLSLVYWTLSDIQYLPKLNSQDFDAMVDCVEHCELLDIRYSGFEQIESESTIAMEEALDGQYTEWTEIIQPLTQNVSMRRDPRPATHRSSRKSILVTLPCTTITFRSYLWQLLMMSA